MSFRGRGNTRTLLPFGLDYSDVLSTDHDIEKPKLILPINAPLTERETMEAKQSINLSKIVLDGPFYTGSSLDDKQKTTTTTQADGIERHSDKYKKIKKVGTTIEEHPYNLEFFPSELYLVMGVTNKKRKKLGLSSYKSNGGISQFEINNNQPQDGKSDVTDTNLLDKLKDLAEDLDNNNNDDKEHDDDDAEDDLEDEFEDEDDDDYNAEKYFDDGDDDFADNDDNGEAEF